MKKLFNNPILQRFIVFIIVFGLFVFWSWKGLVETGVSADVARDLTQVSNLWIHKVVWLGPNLGIGFPISPLYFYLLYPLLVLSGGNGYSLVITEAFFAFVALIVFAWYQLKKSFSSAIIGVLIIGLAPWWISSSASVWNGNMYVSWVLMGLVLLWFQLPLFFPALLIGVAISIHPMAILVLPLLCYEWFSRSKKLLNGVYCILGLALPWSPIILFEIITKGYLTRHWLANPSTSGVHIVPNLGNVLRVVHNIGFGLWIGIIVWGLTFWVAVKREKIWIAVISLSLLVVLFVSNLLHYYLYGLTCAILFIILTVWSTKKIGQIGLFFLILFFTLSIKIPSGVPTRTIGRLNTIVKTVIHEQKLDKTKKYAVASLNEGNKNVPQADDYRFFLRTNGFNALDIERNSEADLLLLFVEAPQLKWEQYENWNIQQFGPRKVISSEKIDGMIVVLYGKK